MAKLSQMTQLSHFVWKVISTRRYGLKNTYNLYSANAYGVVLTVSTTQRFSTDDTVRLLAINTNEQNRLVRKGIEIIWTSRKGAKGPVPAKILKGNI